MEAKCKQIKLVCRDENARLLTHKDWELGAGSATVVMQELRHDRTSARPTYSADVEQC
jgi:hypothetical protein